MNKIKIGCNWSYQLKELIENDVVKVDYIKSGVYGDFYEHFDEMRSLRPVLLHGLGYFEHTGMNDISIIDFDCANELIKKCGCPHYGTHFGIQNKNIDNRTDEEIFEFMSNQTQIFKNKLKVPLLLENTPDSIKDRTVFDIYSKFQHRNLGQFILENDVYFLLDLTHAKISAIFNDWDIKEHITKLPLDRIKEIHINGSGYDNEGNNEDTHQSMEEEDYELLKWILGKCKPDIVTLEYDGIEDEDDSTILLNLERQLKRINSICKN